MLARRSSGPYPTLSDVCLAVIKKRMSSLILCRTSHIWRGVQTREAPPDKGGSPWSTAFVSEGPDESVFSRGTQPAEWGVSSGEHAPWHGHCGKHFLEAWVRLCQCRHWQASSVRFLPLTLRGRGRPWAEGGNSLHAGFGNPKSLHNDLSEMKSKQAK